MINVCTLSRPVASPALRSGAAMPCAGMALPPLWRGRAPRAARVRWDWGRCPDPPRAKESCICVWLVLFPCCHTGTSHAASFAGFLRVWVGERAMARRRASRPAQRLKSYPCESSLY